jgi:hypothetical protein
MATVSNSLLRRLRACMLRRCQRYEAGVTDFLWSMEDIVLMAETVN